MNFNTAEEINRHFRIVFQRIIENKSLPEDYRNAVKEFDSRLWVIRELTDENPFLSMKETIELFFQYVKLYNLDDELSLRN